MQSLTRHLSRLAHGLCFASLSALALYPSSVENANPEPYEFTVVNKLNLNDDQADVAKGVERIMKNHGFSDSLIMAAIVNAYAESGLDPNVVGSAGELGIFQLNPKGLGKTMKDHEMKDIRKSTVRIIGAMRKSKRIMKLEKRKASAAEHVVAFCTEIERPKNMNRRAKQRVKTLRSIMKKNS